MRLLVTGGCGFIGSNFLRYVLQHYGPEMLTNVDTPTAGQLANVSGIAETYGDRYEFLHADLADGDRLEAVMAQHQFFAVIHFAASPETAGPAALLARARHHGVRRFVLVLAEAEASWRALEETALAAQRDSGQEVVIVRAAQLYGPFQPPEEFIPHTIIRALRDEPVALPDQGEAVRDWLHVEDFCAGIFAALLNGQPGGIYDFAAGEALSDLELGHLILDHLGQGRDLLRLAPPPAGHQSASALDAAQARAQLEWKPLHHLAPALRATIDWYVRNREWWEPLRA